MPSGELRMSSPPRLYHSMSRRMGDSGPVGGLLRPHVTVGECEGTGTHGEPGSPYTSCVFESSTCTSCRLNAIRTEAPDLCIAHAVSQNVREELAHLFGGVCGLPVSVGDFTPEIRVRMLQGWRAARDPRWLSTHGVAAGLRLHHVAFFRVWMCS